ncbi:protein SHQ1 homolog isoform X1 [Centruroides sculpturatus]|uniref:protein SHQ1 homolog isoform X1 n=1 Tax=Centruroides sculpturatus TaxID=218467 RepID=UPI000C6D950C|nr:protein SHQ1 homolog isoform X1 [Centruroides sculpturatus]
MLTPKFELNQDDEFLILHIKTPFAKISETEIYFQDYDFKFFSKPYFLRLNLPGKVIENGRESARYDCDKGSFVIHIPKLNHGENFEGLNLLTKLLAPTKCISAVPLIEVLDNNKESSEAIDEFSWEIDQVPFQNEEETVITTIKYGFANNYSAVLNRLKEEIPDCVDLSDPDDKPPYVRKKEKFEAELKHFNEDHYLADLYEDEAIKELIKFETKWEKDYKRYSSHSVKEFTEAEKEKMLKLPNKEYLLDEETRHALYLGLVDILLAFAYNGRTTAGENTVESAWTICKLSGTLSWLVTFHSLNEVAINFIRRSLCYPLYRHWGLSLKVIKDASKILYLGKEYVLKCLLEIHSLLQKYESRYIINDLYIMDYCIWIQTVSTETLMSLSNALSRVRINKEHVKLDLIELEAASVLAIKENESKNDNLTSTTNCTNTRESEVPNKDIEEICDKIEEVSLQSNTNFKLSSQCNYSNSNDSDSESELDSDSESSSSIATSMTDSDDYCSSDSDSEDSSDDNLDERCSLLTKLRS